MSLSTQNLSKQTVAGVLDEARTLWARSPDRAVDVLVRAWATRVADGDPEAGHLADAAFKGRDALDPTYLTH